MQPIEKNALRAITYESTLFFSVRRITKNAPLEVVTLHAMFLVALGVSLQRW
jgi:hypothetical protein